MATEEQKDSTLMERLFSVGAHFGFSKSRRHPTVAPYLYGSKQGTDIIDLEKTIVGLAKAKEVLEEAGRTGKTVLFVGTKEEVASIVRERAERAGAPYVVNRWIGGILTNFSEIKKRLARLNELEEQGTSGELERKYTKKERVVIGRELEKLNHNFGGIKSLEKPPQYLLVVDHRHDDIAVTEADDLNIPVISITSSDGDLKKVTYPIVVNDALTTSVSLVLDELAAALEAGTSRHAESGQENGEQAPRTKES